MRIIFRADASREVGSGHVMRSSVLAEEAISRGFECVFIGQIEGLGWVQNRIASLGFAKELQDVSEFRLNPKTDVLVIDSYTISPSDLFLKKDNWLYLLSVSDKVTPSYDVDAELRPSLELQKQEKSSRQILSGPQHILIRSDISKSDRCEKSNQKMRVLVVGGGSDPFGFVESITPLIESLVPGLEIHCFTNNRFDNHLVSNLNFHNIGNELDFWANEVDLVLTTASTTSLEFIAREVPIGVVCAVDNQRDYYEQLGRLGYASQIGILDLSGKWNFNQSELKDLLTNSVRRNSLRTATQGLIDFQGAARVMDFIEKETAGRRRLISRNKL